MHTSRIIVYFIIYTLASVYSVAPPYYGNDRPTLDFDLPPLEFSFEELEPYIDAETVRVHYLGHHYKYAELTNNVVREWRKQDKLASRISLIEILLNITRVPQHWREAMSKYGAGYLNHNLYWACLSPNKGGDARLPTDQISADIQEKWRSFHDFKNTFTNIANSVFGSGYVWLCRNYTIDFKSNDLLIITGTNEDSPLERGLYPILTLDLWEHAYYLKHRNHRKNYITDWWRVVDWDQVQNLDHWWRKVTNNLGQHDEL